MPKCLTNEEIEILKKREIKILKEIDMVCRKNQIEYSLAYGSLLGAVRHKGFIPWDDDIDIMLERKQYEKFLKVAEQQLGDDFYLVDGYRDKHYGMVFAKVMLKNTVMRESSIKTSKASDGVFVDVFPFDAIPDSEKLRNKQYRKAKFIKRIIICRARYYFGQKGLRLLIYRLQRLLYLMLPKTTWMKMYEKNARRYEECENSSMLGNMAGVTILKHNSYPKEIFKDFIEIEFEGLKCKSVRDYDTVLKTTYGDYMQLPPEDKRIPHHFVEELHL